MAIERLRDYLPVLPILPCSAFFTLTRWSPPNHSTATQYGRAILRGSQA